ncbi:glycosyltransferase [Ensifer sp. ENS10]|uniref:glycosyltransferase n=1 Tax=Ensifer sp. ENS10 TaxID=2769286 RepID=UPI001783C8CE|nr:glycosyltransferase [Ensifer sp. ENS10]MBD9511394.1 glycosyltransferase [Ensifer sp. ENS10]
MKFKSVCSLREINISSVKTSIITFDIFDTLIFRRRLNVNEVHDLSSAYALSVVGQLGRMSPGELTLTRYHISNILKTGPVSALEEPSLEMVWSHVLSSLGIAGERRATLARQIADFEFEVDLQNLEAVDGAMELLAGAKSAGKRIFAISDMYFSSGQINKILMNLGLLEFFEEVLVSASINKTKQTGNLFLHFVETTGFSSAEITHIGDNPISDVKMPAELGLSTIHIQQHASLMMSRPEYGARPDIFTEVVDIVKLFIARVSLAAHNEKLDAIYFLSRDGLIIRDIWEKWQNPIIDKFFELPKPEELYLSRSTSCWLNVDFQKDWFLQVLGHAFWLHNGSATLQQLSATMGIVKIPTSLADKIFRSNTDTFVVLEAYEKDGLLDEIKCAVLEKRQRLLEYLRDCGLLGKKNVAICDVGYSGTVVRDLNTFFLQMTELNDIDALPRIHFFCVSTNENHSKNAVQALPYVHFQSKSILDNESLPEDLKKSFAWLEVFFKHPTLGPLDGYMLRDGKMLPCINHQYNANKDHPSVRLLHHTQSSIDDIVLIWMAAVEYWNSLTEPFIKRMEQPDHSTVEQMMLDVYEADAVTGKVRSIVLIEPDLPRNEIISRAADDDYWIGGSLVASDFARSQEVSGDLLIPDTAEEHSTYKAKPSESALPKGFDPYFYRHFYPDLLVAFHKDDELYHHYKRHGRKEKRFRSEAHLYKVLGGQDDGLPADFDYGSYLWLNRDLAPQYPVRWRAEEHFLRHGRREGRPYLLPSSSLDDELIKMVIGGKLSLSHQEQAAAKLGVSILTILLRRFGLGYGAWIESLNVAEFHALNHAWCGPLNSRAEALVRFLEEGIDRQAPISRNRFFDADFYRAHYEQAKGKSDRDAYRHWLRDGSFVGFFSSERAHIEALIGTWEFPASFEWETFRARQDKKFRTASRVKVLDRFLSSWTPRDPARYLRGAGAGFLWEVVADRALHQRGDQETAIAALRKGIECNEGNVGSLWHKLGDIYFFRRGEMQAAAHCYRSGVSSPVPDNWSYINGANAAKNFGAFETALQFLTDGEVPWQHKEPWLTARRDVFKIWFSTCIQPFQDGTKALDVAYLHACRFLADYADEYRKLLISPLPLMNPGGPIRIISATVDFERIRRHWMRQPVSDVILYEAGEISVFLEDLPGTRHVIFHDLDCSAEAVEAALLCAAFGIATSFWVGELRSFDTGRDPQHPLQDLRLPRLPERHSQGASILNLLLSKICVDVISADPLIPATTFAENRYIELAPLPQLNPGEMFDRSSSTLGSLIYVELPPKTSAVNDRRRGLFAKVLAARSETAPLSRAKVIEFVHKMLAEQPSISFVIGGDSSDLSQMLRSFGTRLRLLPWNTSHTQKACAIASADFVIDAACNVTSFARPSHWASRLGIPFSTNCDASLPGRVEVRTSHDLEFAVVVPTSGVRRVSITTGRIIPETGSAARSSLSHASNAKKRVLIANVFSPLQITGGATRVVADSIDYLLKNAQEEFSVYVIAADDQNANNGASRMDNYRGVPVFTIATPQELDMDWRTYNAEVDAYANWVLDQVKPEFVHIHCLQRLTIAIADACALRAIPYIVTLHDAWWISDYAFMTDESGSVVSVAKAPSEQDMLPRVGYARSVERGVRLRNALSGARKVYAVSASFAALFRSIGIDTVVLENGVRAPSVVRKRNETGRVRLGHVGGLEFHKGAFLIEAALKQNKFENLSLTILDLARGAGNETRTLWGTTPVTVTGKLPAEKVGELYGSMDVLVAPSIWPESFGLVSREALLSGLWLIAGNQGSMGECVLEEKNGFVVNVRDPVDLARVLRVIDANPERFMRPPTEQSQIRTIDEYGRELLQVYRALAS